VEGRRTFGPRGEEAVLWQTDSSTGRLSMIDMFSRTDVALYTL